MAEEGRPKISELATVPIQPAQWYTLGLALGLEEDVLNRIEVEQSHKSVKCKRVMFRIWLESNPTASWNNLLKALVQIGEQETAEKVRKEFCLSQPSVPGDDGDSNKSVMQGEYEVDHGISDLVRKTVNVVL